MGRRQSSEGILPKLRGKNGKEQTMKIRYTCSNCGQKFQSSAMVGVPDGMFLSGHETCSRSESESEQGVESVVVDAKPSDLPLSRLKSG